MFGEIGILDGSPRTTSARALEKSRIKIIARKDFQEWLRAEPDAAMKVMGSLMERLRTADAIIARQQEVQQLASATYRRLSLMDGLRALLRRFRPPAINPVMGGLGEMSPPPFVIGVATVNNDIDAAWTRALAGLFEGRPGLSVRVLSQSIQMPQPADQGQVAAAVLRARQILAHEDDVDLLLWGDVHAEGYSLWLTSAGAVDDDRPGGFSPYFRLEIPGDQETPLPELLTMTVLAAVEPLSDRQRTLQRSLLPEAMRALPNMLGGLPVAWSLDQQRAALTAYGHAAATVAGWENDLEWFDHAATVYNAALQRLTAGQHGMDEALLRKHLGAVLLAVGDQRRDGAGMEQAVEALRAVPGCIVKMSYPQEWALAQNRLGQGLYKLDLLTGQTDALKEAMAAYQAALTVFTRMEAPYRWADVMDNLAQVLQVYGDHMKSAEVLERAIETCRSALEFRSRERMPLSWAASQNTLGTALFLLDRLLQTTEHLEQARAAFTSAAEVYRGVGATRQAKVAEKNLAHVQKLLATRNERKMTLYDWADDED